MERISGLCDSIIFTLLFVFIVILSLRFKDYYLEKPSISKVFIFSLHIWTIRYLLIAVDYFDTLAITNLFSRRYFSSSFGYGFADSLGDITISIIILAVNISYLYYFLFSAFNNIYTTRKTQNSITLFLFFLLSDIVFFLLIRAYGSALRSIVYDSNLKLYDFRSILPSFPLSIIYINVFIIGISLFILLVTIIIPQIKYWNYTARSMRTGIILISAFLLTGLGYLLIEKNPQVDFTVFVFITVSIPLLSFIFHNLIAKSGKLLNFRSGFLMAFLSILITFVVFNGKVENKQKSDIERKADELVRPIDDYISYIMNKTMSQLAIDETLPALLSSFDEQTNYDEAFIRWLNSPLSQEKYNSAFIMFDKNGKIISQFSIGILDNDIRFFAKNVIHITQSMINLYQTGTSSLKHYIGTEPIYFEGYKIGTVVIIIATDENIFLRNSAPDYLRTYSMDERFSEMQNIIISEFYNFQLVSSTNTIYSKDQRLDPAAIDLLSKSERNNRGVWIRESINERSFNSYYINSISKSTDRIYSLSLEDLDLRWHLYNFFKLIFTNFLVVSSFVILFLIYKLIRREKVFLSFRTKILLSLLSISMIPLIILWFYTENYIQNQNQKMLIRNISNDIDVLSNSLLRHFGGVIDSTTLINHFTLQDAKVFSENSGRDFNIYLGDSLIVSSRPEMYKTELVSRYISTEAYQQLYLYGKNFHFENATIGSFPYLVGYVPITSSQGKTIGILSVPVIFKDSLTERDLAQSLAFIFGGYILIFFVILTIGYYLSKIISTPIKNLTEATGKIISGNMETTIPVTGNDEIAELITSFNKMTHELKESQKELAKAEREAAWKEMARQVAHEIKNPLTPMKLSVQHLQRIVIDKAANFDEIFIRVSKTLLEQIDTLTKIVSGFSHFAKMPERVFANCDIHEIITQAINLFKEEKAIDFEVNFCDNAKVIEGDPEELRRVFINLIRNSIQAIHAGNVKNGKIKIETLLSGKNLIIRITDNGIGIKDENLSKIFDVNYSTKKDGMGLGLKISRKTIRDLGGDIKVFSSENEGAMIEITL